MRWHKELFLKYKTEVKQGKSSKAIKQGRVRKPNPLGFKVISGITKKQQRLNDNIVEYITASMKPFSTVDDPNFVRLFDFDKELKIMSRGKLMRLIKRKCSRTNDETVMALSKAEYFCTMADIWSSKHHSYMGVTVHWLDDDLKRHSRVLDCAHFENPHSHDRTAEIIGSIHTDYELGVGNIVCTITDSASIMVKAFRIFGVSLQQAEANAHPVQIAQPEAEDGDGSDNEEEGEANVEDLEDEESDGDENEQLLTDDQVTEACTEIEADVRAVEEHLKFLPMHLR